MDSSRVGWPDWLHADRYAQDSRIFPRSIVSMSTTCGLSLDMPRTMRGIMQLIYTSKRS